MNSMRYLRRSSFMVGGVVKGEFHNLFTRLWKLHSHNVFDFILYFRLFYTYSKDTDQPRVNGNPNPEFIQENNLKPKFHPVEFVYALFTVYIQKKSGNPLFSLLKTCWSGQIKKRLIWGWMILYIPILCRSRWMSLIVVYICNILVV